MSFSTLPTITTFSSLCHLFCTTTTSSASPLKAQLEGCLWVVVSKVWRRERKLINDNFQWIFRTVTFFIFSLFTVEGRMGRVRVSRRWRGCFRTITANEPPSLSSHLCASLSVCLWVMGTVVNLLKACGWVGLPSGEEGCSTVSLFAKLHILCNRRRGGIPQRL